MRQDSAITRSQTSIPVVVMSYLPICHYLSHPENTETAVHRKRVEAHCNDEDNHCDLVSTKHRNRFTTVQCQIYITSPDRERGGREERPGALHVKVRRLKVSTSDGNKTKMLRPRPRSRPKL